MKDRPSVAEDVAQFTYTSFFHLSVAGFLCLCQDWWRMMYARFRLDNPPWHMRNLTNLSVVYVALAAMEGLYAWYYMNVGNAVAESCYFLWLSMVTVLAVLEGTHVVCRLRRYAYSLMERRRRENGDGFLAVSAASATAAYAADDAVALTLLPLPLTIGLLVLSISWVLYGRYYAWPCLICYTLQRIVEAACTSYILLLGNGPEGLLPRRGFERTPRRRARSGSNASGNSTGSSHGSSFATEVCSFNSSSDDPHSWHLPTLPPGLTEPSFIRDIEAYGNHSHSCPPELGVSRERPTPPSRSVQSAQPPY
eukprot:TRINITY_DN51821_c1_g1_i2.p1 TRINITY_DN51821_c1_g1~~TRINITY_DN51821_c1_g1_i2.p1  ORF type:complete len:309 (-),score=-13.35 TRINITY_DN51821_c1_g1_i2:467-1393(-)